MKQLKAYKFRIYPSEEQKIFFSKTFGCVRLVYNLMLNDRIKAYEESKGNPDKKLKYPTPAKYKKEYDFLKEVDRLYPSSQICSVCGNRDGKKTLDIREWICPVCHTHHDRDINASKNILAEGLRIRETA